eukprot:jgi/Astpho2/3713/fgenesh1_pg.00060_%23_30_t
MTSAERADIDVKLEARFRLRQTAQEHQRRADDAKKAGQLERAMALYKKVAEMWPTAGTFLDCAQCAEIQNDHVAVVKHASGVLQQQRGHEGALLLRVGALHAIGDTLGAASDLRASKVDHTTELEVVDHQISLARQKVKGVRQSKKLLVLEKAHGRRQGKGLLWHQCSLALKGTRSGYAQHVLGHCHEQLQTQLEETLQLTAQLRAQRQGLALVSAAPQAKVEAKKIVTLDQMRVKGVKIAVAGARALKDALAQEVEAVRADGSRGTASCASSDGAALPKVAAAAEASNKAGQALAAQQGGSCGVLGATGDAADGQGAAAEAQAQSGNAAAQQRDPQLHEKERLRGNDLYRAGKLEAALGCSLSIHSADPTDIHALDNLTLTYLKLGMNERAVRAAEQMLKQPKGNHVKAWAYTATASLSLKHWDLAIKACHMARRKVKAGLRVSQGATTKEQVYQELLKRHPAVVRSRQSTAKTCPQAGSSCATHPEEQLQAGEELIVGPQTCNTQQVAGEPAGAAAASDKTASDKTASDKTATASYIDENVSAQAAELNTGTRPGAAGANCVALAGTPAVSPAVDQGKEGDHSSAPAASKAESKVSTDTAITTLDSKPDASAPVFPAMGDQSAALTAATPGAQQAGSEQAQMSAAHAHLQTRHLKQPQAATKVLQARGEDLRRLAFWQQTCLTVADDLASNDPRIPRSLMRDVIFSDGSFVSKIIFALVCRRALAAQEQAVLSVAVKHIDV